MLYVGVDYHKRYSMVTEMEESGKIKARKRIENTPEGLKGYFRRMPPRTKVALEATGSWYYFYELLEGLGLDIHLAHPLKTKAIASAKIKTDKIDSEVLGHLLRADLLPESYIPARGIRDTREVLRYRASLVFFRSSLKCKVRAILGKNGMDLPWSDPFGKNAKRFLRSVSLRPCYRLALDGYLSLAEALKEQIDGVNEVIDALVKESDGAKRLTSIPGIGRYSALLISAEIGDVSRFRNARKLASYAGLVPSVHQSGGRSYRGGLTKQGSRWLRWILVELAPHAAKGSLKLGLLYERVRRKHGANTAKVAVAREMLKAIYYILRDGRTFEDNLQGMVGRSGFARGVMSARIG